MPLKILFPPKLGFSRIIIILILFFSSISANSQCSGNDTSITVFGDDLPKPSNQAINLFSLLGGGAVPGGTWTDDLFSGGLNLTTGILNAQIINKSGVYTYTYTSTIGCADNSATITVIIGGYAGVPAPTASACSDNSNFDLFQVFDGNALSPQSNGIWSDNDGTGALTGSILDAGIATLGTHSFTYTMPAIGTCPARSSTVNVTVFRAPESGVASNLWLCSSEYLTFNTNFNLNSLLTGEDANGTWTESGTAELSGPLDSTVDVRHIYDTFGAGAYSFTYAVPSTNPICKVKKSTVTIIIEKQLDFTGATFNVIDHLCEDFLGVPVAVDLFQGIQKIPNGAYDVTYTISGVPSPITITEVFIDGKMKLFIPYSNFVQVGTYTIAITNIVRKPDSGICTTILGTLSDVLKIVPIPRIDNATLSFGPVCKGSGAAVEISGDTNLTDGNYKIDYNLSGSNTAVAKQAVFSVTSGVGNFAIPANLIPVEGKTTISITKIKNGTTGCTNTSTLSKDFVINALTVVPSFSMIINAICQNQPISVSLSGLGSLTNITLKYNLIGTVTTINQTVTIPVSSGNASFTILSASFINIGTGITSLVITDLIDNDGGCGVLITNGTKNFTINAVPNVPITNDEKFCKSDNKTIADLSPKGIQYQWFDSLTSTTVLSASTLLVSGNYYVKEVNAVTGCESGRAMANVIINDVQVPTLNQDGQNFCGLDNPTLQNLTDNIATNGALTWFDAPINGNQIVSTELLVDGFTYYGFNFSSDTNCYSDALEVTVSLSNCNVTPGFFIPDGFSPNGDAVNDTFSIPDIEFIYPNYSLEIYNRYGNLMFTGNINKPNWDGKSSDANIAIDGFAPNGVYFYIINYNKGNKPPKQGRLYLNR
jgi:gliding motility-associated-like protein